MESSGIFSRALLEIEIQLDDLIEKAGGIEGIRMLDLMGSLQPSERAEIVNSLISTMESMNETKREKSCPSAEKCCSSQTKKSPRLTVIEGGLQQDGCRKTG